MVDIHNEILFSHKKNDILSFTVKLMNLEDIIISKINQTQKFFMFSICGYLKSLAECIIALLGAWKGRWR